MTWRNRNTNGNTYIYASKTCRRKFVAALIVKSQTGNNPNSHQQNEDINVGIFIQWKLNNNENK